MRTRIEVVRDAVTLGKGVAIQDAENAVYEAACYWAEGLENLGHHRGNGHHTAQEIAAFARKLMKERWIEKGGAA